MWTTLFIIQFIITCFALPILLLINIFQWRVETKIHQEVGDIPRLLHRLLPISCLFLITFIIPDTSHDIHFIHNLLADLNSTLLLYILTLIVYHTRATIARTDSTEIKHRKRWCHLVGISTACCALGVNVAEYHLDRLWPHTIFLIWYFTCLLIHIIAVLIFLLRLISLLEHHNIAMAQTHSLSSLNPTSRFIRVTPTIASPTTIGRKLHPSSSSFSLPPTATSHRRPSQYTLQKIAQDIARAQLISRFRVRVLLLVVPGVAALISLVASTIYLFANLSIPYGGAPIYASLMYCILHIFSITCSTAFGWLSITRNIIQQILCCHEHIDMIPSHHRTPSTHSINKKTRTPKKDGIHVTLHTSNPQSSPTERDSMMIEPSPLSATHVTAAYNAVPPAQLAEITSPSSSPCPSPSESRSDDNLQHIPSVPSFVVMLLNAQQSQQSSHHPSPSTSISHKAHTHHVHEMITLHEFGPMIIASDVSTSTSPRLSMMEQQPSMISDEKRHVSIVSDQKRHVSVSEKRHVSMDEKRNSIDDHISISQQPATIEELETDVTSDMV